MGGGCHHIILHVWLRELVAEINCVRGGWIGKEGLRVKAEAWITDAPPSCSKAKPLKKMIMGVVEVCDNGWRVGGWDIGGALSNFHPAATPQQAECASGGGGLVSQGEVEAEHIQTQPLNGVK